jgi:GNAT superfamily N-acetyltransferase
MRHEIAIEPHGGEGWRAMVILRDRVLRAPLGLAFTADQLAEEVGQIHLALRLAGPVALRLATGPGRVIGTVLIARSGPDGARLRQMAIDPDFVGRGLGGALLGRAENEVLALGLRDITLSARETAVGFYARYGYRAEGDAYVEVTVPHRSMRKRLMDGQGRRLPRHQRRTRMNERSETGDAELMAALREAGEEVARARAHGASDFELARVAVADFLRHLPPAVFEDRGHDGEPINHALAHAVERLDGPDA